MCICVGLSTVVCWSVLYFNVCVRESENEKERKRDREKTFKKILLIAFLIRLSIQCVGVCVCAGDSERQQCKTSDMVLLIIKYVTACTLSS